VLQIQAGDCQRLAGVAVGGWIVVSLLAGMALGALGVLSLQFFRRRRDVRYGLPTTAVRPLVEAAIDRLGQGQRASRLTACLRHVCIRDHPQPRRTPPQSQEHPSSLAHGGKGPAPPQSASPQLPPLKPAREPVLRGPRPAPPAGAAAHFSPLTASVHIPGGAHGAQLAGKGAAAGARASAAAVGDTFAGDQQQARKQAGADAGAAAQHVGQPAQHQLHNHQQQQQQASGPPQAAAPPAPEPSDPPVPQTSPPSPSSAAAAAHDLDDAYDPEDLDEDWKALLDDVDGRLAAAGARPLDARERAVAIKKLLVATATKGVDYAMVGGGGGLGRFFWGGARGRLSRRR
jgi:hypothetical protein